MPQPPPTDDRAPEPASRRGPATQPDRPARQEERPARQEDRPAQEHTSAEQIGRRVRQLREERGVSLSALARRAGIGKATLSGLENGTRNPTLETLYAVTAQLGVPLTAVLARPGAGPSGPTATGPTVRGTAVTATLLEVFTDADATYELYRMRVAPGPPQLSPAHQAGVTEHITVFAGVLHAGPLTAPGTATPGGYLTWRSDVPHSYAALGDEEVQASLLLRYPTS